MAFFVVWKSGCNIQSIFHSSPSVSSSSSSSPSSSSCGRLPLRTNYPVGLVSRRASSSPPSSESSSSVLSSSSSSSSSPSVLSSSSSSSSSLLVLSPLSSSPSSPSSSSLPSSLSSSSSRLVLSISSMPMTMLLRNISLTSVLRSKEFLILQNFRFFNNEFQHQSSWSSSSSLSPSSLSSSSSSPSPSSSLSSSSSSLSSSSLPSSSSSSSSSSLSSPVRINDVIMTSHVMRFCVTSGWWLASSRQFLLLALMFVLIMIIIIISILMMTMMIIISLPTLLTLLLLLLLILILLLSSSSSMLLLSLLLLLPWIPAWSWIWLTLTCKETVTHSDPSTVHSTLCSQRSSSSRTSPSSPSPSSSSSPPSSSSSFPLSHRHRPPQKQPIFASLSWKRFLSLVDFRFRYYVMVVLVMEALVMTSSKDPESSRGTFRLAGAHVVSKNRTEDPESFKITSSMSKLDGEKHPISHDDDDDDDDDDRDCEVPSTSSHERQARSPSQSTKRVYLARGLSGSVACPFRTSPPEVLITWSKNGFSLFLAQNGDYADGDTDDGSYEDARAVADVVAAKSSTSSSSLGGLVVYQDSKKHRQRSLTGHNGNTDARSDHRQPLTQRHLNAPHQLFKHQNAQHRNHPYSQWRSSIQPNPDIPANRVRVTKEGHLKFKVVIDEDEGTYACHKYSPFSVANRNSTYFKVLVREIPTFLTRPSDFYQPREGLTITMTCVVNGEPKPAVIWRKMDGLFPPINRTLQEEGNLTLARVTSEDEGRYECVTFNLLGMTLARTALIVEDGRAHGPTQVEVVTSSTCMTVSWYPAYHPQTPDPSFCHYLIWYRISERNASESNWTTMAPPPDTSTLSLQISGTLTTVSTTTYTTICDLQPLTRYEVTVMSRDSEGHAMFSQLATGQTKGPIRKNKKDRTKTKDKGSPALQEKREPATPVASNPSLWRRPTSPRNLTVTLRNGGLLLSWQSPPPLYFRRLKSEPKPKPNLKPKATNDSISEDHDAALSTLSENVPLGREKPTTTGVTDSQHHRHHHHHHRHQQNHYQQQQQHHVQSQRQQLSSNAEFNATNKSEVAKVRELSKIKASYCVIEFKTLGRWVPLSGKLNSNLTQFLWSTVSMGTVYHFRVVCYYALVSAPRKAGKALKFVKGRYSKVVQFSTEVPSPQPAVRMSNAKVGGVIFIVMVTLFVLSSTPFLFKFLKGLRKRHSRGLEYVCAKHGGTTGNHHTSNSTNTLKNKLNLRDADVTTTGEQNNMTSNHISMTRTAVSSQSCQSELIEIEASV